MSLCGPLHSQSSLASSERPTQSPLRVPTITTVLATAASRPSSATSDHLG
jgi:hypothetical protein